MSLNKPALKIDWCSYGAAKYAVEHWHYSKRMPAGKTIKIGIWENGQFIGVVIFSRGANNHIGSPYQLTQIQICELTRIAMTKHSIPISRIISVCLSVLKRGNPGLRLVISYADPEQNHVGIIYQASNWIYVGISQPQCFTLGLNGHIIHKRTAHSKYGTIVGLPRSKILWKHKYCYPFDNEIRKVIESHRQPYPKRATSETADTSGDHPEKRGSIPTVALQNSGQCE